MAYYELISGEPVNDAGLSIAKQAVRQIVTHIEVYHLKMFEMGACAMAAD